MINPQTVKNANYDELSLHSHKSTNQSTERSKQIQVSCSFSRICDVPNTLWLGFVYDSTSLRRLRRLNVCLRGRRWDEIFRQWCQEWVGVFSFLPEQQAVVSVNVCHRLHVLVNFSSTPVAVPLAAVILFLLSWASSLKHLSGGGLFTSTRRRCIQLM